MWALLDELNEHVSRIAPRTIRRSAPLARACARRSVRRSAPAVGRSSARRLRTTRCRRHIPSLPVGATLRACNLAREALTARGLDAGGGSMRYATLELLFAENISVQTASLEQPAIDSADAVKGAHAMLLG